MVHECGTTAHFSIHKLSTLWNENTLNLCFHMAGHNLCIAIMCIVALRTFEMNVLTVNWINGSYVRKRIPSVRLQVVYGPVTGR